MSSSDHDGDQTDVKDKDVDKKLSSFEARWKFLVFPAMIAFVILAGFGFYLIYGMLQRMEDLAADVNRMADVVGETMPVMQGGVVSMSSRMQWVGEDLDRMTTHVARMSDVVSNTMPNMEQRVGDMSNNINNMTYATSSMANSTHSMGQNIWNMNRNVSKPLSIMRKMMPFGESDDTPPPRRAPYTYNAYGQYYPTYTRVPHPSSYSVTNNQVATGTTTTSTAKQATAVTTTPSTKTTETKKTGKTQEQKAPTTTTNQEKPKAESAAKKEQKTAAAQQPQATTTADANKQKAFEEAYRAGAERFIGVCASCHGTNAAGGFGPAITGYSAKQMEDILNEYRDGKRTGTMTGLVKTLTATELKNIALFLEYYGKQ
jgi:mono/diheme cytochrome c family protein